MITANDQRPSVRYQRPTTSGQRPAAIGQRSVTSGQPPAASDQRSAASDQRSAAGGATPVQVDAQIVPSPEQTLTLRAAEALLALVDTALVARFVRGPRELKPAVAAHVGGI